MRMATCHPDKSHYAKGFCRTCHKKDWYNRNPGAHQRHHRITYLRRKASGKVTAYEYKKKYGITVDQFNTMFKDQDGRCAICVDELKKPNVDHNHWTGKVRGLLCMNCNFLVGQYERKSDIAENLEVYLEGNLTFR